MKRPGPSSRPSRSAVERSLEQLGAEVSPAPDAEFLQRLEQRIATLDDVAITPERRPLVHRLRARVVLAVGAVVAAATAAALALSPGGQPGLGIANDPVITTLVVPETTTAPVPAGPTTTSDGDFVHAVVLPTAALNVTPPPPAETTMVAATSTVPIRTTLPVTTAPPTSAPPSPATSPVATSPSSTLPATTTVVNTVVVTTAQPRSTSTAPLQLTCLRQTATSIVCSWTPWPGAGVIYRLGRVSAADPTSQVLFDGAGPNSFTDTTVGSGDTATYRVQALGADGSLLAQSNLQTVR